MPAQVRLKSSQQSLDARGLSTTQKNVLKSKQGGLLPLPDYSLYSSESELDQVAAVNGHLNRCASLLGDILGDKTGVSSKPREIKAKQTRKKTVRIRVPRSEAAASTKISLADKTKKRTAFNKQLLSSTPAPTEDSTGSAASTELLIAEKHRLEEYLQQVALQKTLLEEEYVTALQNSGGAGSESQLAKRERCHDTPRQNQVDALQHPRPAIATAAAFHNAPTTGGQELYGLLSSISEKLALGNSIKSSAQVTRDHGDGSAPVRDQQVSPDDQCRAVDAAMTHHPPSNHARSLVDKFDGSASDGIPETRRNGDETSSMASSCNCRCVRAPEPNTPTRSVAVQFSSDQELLSSRKPSMAGDYSSRDRQYSRANSLITTLTYLLKELKAMLGDKRDLEVERLLNEVDHVVNTLPFALSDAAPDVGENVTSVLVPIQSENAELRGKVKLLNQKVREVNAALAEAKLRQVQMVSNAEKAAQLSLEGSHRRLMEEVRRRETVEKQFDHVAKEFAEVKSENSRLLLVLSQKDSSHAKESHDWQLDRAKMEAELSSARCKIEEARLFGEANEKEKQIIVLSLKQRDSEIQRLKSLNLDLQESVSKLLNDLHMERAQVAQPKLFSATPVATSPRHCRPSARAKTKSPVRARIPKSNSTLLDEDEAARIASSESESTLVSASSLECDVSRCVTQTSSSRSNCSLGSVFADTNVSTLDSRDQAEFERDLANLDAKILRVHQSLAR